MSALLLQALPYVLGALGALGAILGWRHSIRKGAQLEMKEAARDQQDNLERAARKAEGEADKGLDGLSLDDKRRRLRDLQRGS